MKDSHKYVWKFLFKVPGCHSWFRNELNGRIAVCDDSGLTPDRTDDGVLYLPARCIIQRGSYNDPRLWIDEVEIPVEHESGEFSQLGGTNYREAIELVQRGLAVFRDRI